MRRLDWQEPAHPAMMRHIEELISIYKVIRDKYQTQIDDAFDKVSRQVGFVVTMSLPAQVIVAKGRAESVRLAGSHLRGTLWEHSLGDVLKGLPRDLPGLADGDPIPAFSDGDPDGNPAIRDGDPDGNPSINEMDPDTSPARGVYDFRLIWFKGLRLKLRTDWLEPAHFRDWARFGAGRGRFPGRPWEEPAHVVFEPEGMPWAEGPVPDPWVEGPGPQPWREGPHPEPWRDRLVITAIDEVYPELKLVDRLQQMRAVGPGMARMARRWRVGPDVPEPAHEAGGGWQFDPAIAELIANVVRRRVPPEVHEPAHVSRRITPELLQEIEAVLQRYGF